MNDAFSKHRRLWSSAKRKITLNITPITMISFVLIVIVCVVIPIIFFDIYFKNAENTNEGVITVLDGLKIQANAETENNMVPRQRTEEKIDIQLIGKLSAEDRLVSTVKGDYSYTLYKFTYKVEKVVQGEFIGKNLTFFIERRSPIQIPGSPPSRVFTLPPWPFLKNYSSTFKLRNGEKRYFIVLIGLNYPR